MLLFPRPSNQVPWVKGDYQGFHYEFYLTGPGLASTTLEGKDIVRRMAFRERSPGVACFPQMTPEKMEKSVDGEVGAIVFVTHSVLQDVASCTLQWQNHCFVDGRPPQVWVFDLCRTYPAGKKGKVSPTGVLFALVQQFAVAAAGVGDIYLMVDTAQEPQNRDRLVQIYEGYGFRIESNPGCLLLQRMTMKKGVEPRFRQRGHNVFLPLYRPLVRHRWRPPKTVRGGRVGKARRRTGKRRFTRW